MIYLAFVGPFITETGVESSQARISHRAGQVSCPVFLSATATEQTEHSGITHLIREPETALKKRGKKQGLFFYKVMMDSKHGQKKGWRNDCPII